MQTAEKEKQVCVRRNAKLGAKGFAGGTAIELCWNGYGPGDHDRVGNPHCLQGLVTLITRRKHCCCRIRQTGTADQRHVQPLDGWVPSRHVWIENAVWHDPVGKSTPATDVVHPGRM